MKFPLTGGVKGKRVLIVDDVNDTGDTLVVARAHLDEFHPAEVRTAVLHEKATSPVHADYHAAEVLEWRWMIYPWARVEDIGGFIRAMDPPPADTDEVIARLKDEYAIEIDRAEAERIQSVMTPPGSA